jgi:hypothetical protein
MKVAAAGLAAFALAAPALRADRPVLLADPVAAPAIIEMPLVSTLRRFIHMHPRIEMTIKTDD